MSYMFSSCENLKEANLFSFKTNNVNNMSHMFQNCINMIILDLSSFNTKKSE